MPEQNFEITLRKTTLRRFGIHAVLALALAAGLPAYSQDFHWNNTIAPGRAIEIKSVLGNITAESASTNVVEVSASKHGRLSDPGKVHVEVVESGSGVTICAVYPSPDGRNECKPGDNGRMEVDNNDVAVDFTVKVPAGVRFVGRTVNGKVEALSLPGEVEAYAVNGSIRVSGSGQVQGSTVNGSIDASFANLNKPSDFHTVNGEITIGLPAKVQAELSASTGNGQISSDFPLTVHASPAGKEMSGAIAGGGPQLVLKTVNGSIRLRRMQ